MNFFSLWWTDYTVIKCSRAIICTGCQLQKAILSSSNHDGLRDGGNSRTQVDVEYDCCKFEFTDDQILLFGFTSFTKEEVPSIK